MPPSPRIVVPHNFTEKDMAEYRAKYQSWESKNEALSWDTRRKIARAYAGPPKPRKRKLLRMKRMDINGKEYCGMYFVDT